MMVLVFFSQIVFAQDRPLTRIFGTVIDKESGEPIPYVNASFKSTTIGTVSDGDGKFYIESYDATDTLKISFIGYDPIFRPIKIGESQTLKVQLEQSQTQLKSVTISGKKERYRNKDNPAVTMIRKVIQNKARNRAEAYSYFEYDKYEKVEFDLNNISEKFMNRKTLKKFQVIFDYMDTSEINGKTYIPIFLRETSSKVYYRRNPRREVEYRNGEKMTGLEEYFDSQGISAFVDKIYQDINIYDNNINVLTQKFISPISSIGPITYMYYIADTLEVNDQKYYKLSFRPRNDNDLAFVGNMLISTDTAYAVKRIDMRLSDKTNLNYVRDLFIEQDFEKNEHNKYDLVQDKINIDFAFLENQGLGLFGKRTVSYKDLKYNEPRDEEIYKGVSNLVIAPDATSQDEAFWDESRHMELSRSEEGVFEMVDEVKELPAFKRLMDIITFISIGYFETRYFDIGPANSFASWNEIEGFRMKFGGQTSRKLSENHFFQTYGAYGELDEEWKYLGRYTYFWNRNPIHSLTAAYQKEIINPGEQFQYASEDNFLLSIKRGTNDKRIYTYKAELLYLKEYNSGFSYQLGIKKYDLEPGGILSFAPGENTLDPEIYAPFIPRAEREKQTLETLEGKISLRFAPNQQYYHGKIYRVPIVNKHPIFTIDYAHGFNAPELGGEYTYDQLSVGLSKRTFVAPAGYFDLGIKANRTWGQLPYPLLDIPRANQTFSYQVNGYNLMNFLEFVSDQSVDVNFAYYFNGFIMNKIPLIKHMKLRSVVTFKGLFGQLSDLNNPTLEQNPELPDLPINVDGTQASFPLENYIESSVGISNIFKVLRVDLVRRWTQQDRANVPKGYHIRMKMSIEF